jgi:hypothetical protein
VNSLQIPATGSAEVHVLHDGYVGLDGDRVSGTVTLILDGDAVIPGHGAQFRPGTPA